MAVAGIELENEMDLGRSAVVQIEEIGVSTEIFSVDQLMDLPGEAARKLEEFDAVMVLADMTDRNYISEAVSEIMRIDADTSKPVAKVLDEKRVRDRHTYQREMKGLAGQRGEKLARELT
mgnify:CR=1 FL=1